MALLVLLLSAPLLLFGQGSAWNLSLLKLAQWASAEAECAGSIEEIDGDGEEVVSRLECSSERRQSAGKKPNRARMQALALERRRLVSNSRLQPEPDRAPHPILYRHLTRRLN